jgi:starvation-inducible outer membrane lipoprotein
MLLTLTLALVTALLMSGCHSPPSEQSTTADGSTTALKL